MEAKITASTTKFCPACSMNVSLKTWTAHTTGRKHKQRVAELKAQAAKEARESQSRTEKRLLSHDSATNVPAAKKQKVEQVIAGSTNGTHSDPKNELSFIPAGFFDNPEKDSKTEASATKAKELDVEYSKFMNEISATQEEVAADDEVDVRTFNNERQLEAIDETMGYWQSLNELEKKREEMASKRMETEASANDVSDDDSDVDFEGDNWRSRKIF